MSEEIKLKPCPFCGGEAEMLGDDDRMYQVFCPNCKATIVNFDDEKEVAAEKWNKRTTEKDLNEQIGRFKKYAEALENEIKELREALTFYAKGEHLGLEDWQTEQILKDDDVFAESYVETGKRAREALKADKYSD